MAKCVKCGKRKAKRDCPALGEGICSLCCGRLREKDIHCPSHCVYLASHQSYQARRIIDKKPSSLAPHLDPHKDPLGDERLAWLVYHIETPLVNIAEQDPSLSDRQALMSLEYARETLEKGQGVILMPNDPVKPKNKWGELILASMENCRFDRGIILTQEQNSYTREEKLICLERAVLSIKYASSENLEGRNYLDQLCERLNRVEKATDTNNLIKF